jgi:hypothetical protein
VPLAAYMVGCVRVVVGRAQAQSTSASVSGTNLSRLRVRLLPKNQTPRFFFIFINPFLKDFFNSNLLVFFETNPFYRANLSGAANTC